MSWTEPSRWYYMDVHMTKHKRDEARLVRSFLCLKVNGVVFITKYNERWSVERNERKWSGNEWMKERTKEKAGKKGGTFGRRSKRFFLSEVNVRENKRYTEWVLEREQRKKQETNNKKKNMNNDKNVIPFLLAISLWHDFVVTQTTRRDYIETTRHSITSYISCHVFLHHDRQRQESKDVRRFCRLCVV